jgi:hypothetical protein
MSQPSDDPPPETSEDPQKPIHINLRLDPVHYAALQRIAGGAHLKDQQVLRHLIRIADRFMQGKASPFVDKLEGIFPQRKAG